MTTSLKHCFYTVVGGNDFLELFDTLPEPDNFPNNTTEYQKKTIKLENHSLPQTNSTKDRNSVHVSTSQYVTILKNTLQNIRISRLI